MRQPLHPDQAANLGLKSHQAEWFIVGDDNGTLRATQDEFAYGVPMYTEGPFESREEALEIIRQIQRGER